MEINPRVVFERLFGEAGPSNPGARKATLQTDRSILDSVRDDMADVVRGLGTRDRAKLDEYVDAVREVERGIQRAETVGLTDLPAVNRPLGIPDSYIEHARLMFGLQLL